MSRHVISPFTFLASSQVSHHPPAAAHHAASEKGWTLRQEITLASKFRGKYLSIMPLGESPNQVVTPVVYLYEWTDGWDEDLYLHVAKTIKVEPVRYSTVD